jgi:hypothetical protein
VRLVLIVGSFLLLFALLHKQTVANHLADQLLGGTLRRLSGNAHHVSPVISVSSGPSHLLGSALAAALQAATTLPD